MNNEIATLNRMSEEIDKLIADAELIARVPDVGGSGVVTEDPIWSAIWQLQEAQKSLDKVASELAS